MSDKYPASRARLNKKYAEVARVWHDNQCLKKSSILAYLRWLNRFELYCQHHSLEVRSQLTLVGATKFASWYTRKRNTDVKGTLLNSRRALRAWAIALNTIGKSVPDWGAEPTHSRCPTSSLMREFASHLQEHRGSPAGTIKKKISHVEAFQKSLPTRRRNATNIRLRDIDAFVVHCRKRYARRTIADMCCSIRTFLHFLHSTGRISVDLASSVKAPIVRKGERPLRTLPWSEVQRILRSIDQTHAIGKRDYTLLLLMSSYGLGAGEVIRLILDDVDWHNNTLRVTRPKTGVTVLLPLLPAVARALATYLRVARSSLGTTRHLFLSSYAPYRPFTCSSPVRHILVKHAQAAGVKAEYLGSHVLRHSYANRLMEQGARTKVIGDILGHRRAESTSAYLRTSTEQLRQIALAVPQ